MSQITIPFDQNPNQTVTYEEAIACYQKMADLYPGQLRFVEAGPTDMYEPIHTAILSTSGLFDPVSARKAGKRILLINNGIHPGEPEGIDATIILVRKILGEKHLAKALEDLVVVIIPVYNVDGCINRNSYSRANQEGPEAYGFRGNARNLDLNRDFLKSVSRNARTFNKIFTQWSPDIFVDNHTSNGADYQYVMTLIATQHDKLEKPLGEFLQSTMLPRLYSDMKKKNWEMIPYVDGFTEIPDSGIAGFCDYGRYSTGYAALWNTIGFMPETHMLKPFKDRLWSTLAFMETVIEFMGEFGGEIATARNAAFVRTRSATAHVVDYAMDVDKFDMITFKGFAAKYKPSEVSGLPRLWYDRTEPFEKQIPYFNYFRPSMTIEKPAAYIIPFAWEGAIERMRNNGVVMETLTENKDLETENYFIRDFKTRDVYEGGYLHSGVKVEKKTFVRHFRRGDVLIRTGQDADRYIIETLEPQAPDSWFAWNYFDGPQMQKEYFSAYVFEDLAAEFLKENPAIRAELEAKKKEDAAFAGNAKAQLDWVYRKSPWYEPTHQLYPVGRVVKL